MNRMFCTEIPLTLQLQRCKIDVNFNNVWNLREFSDFKLQYFESTEYTENVLINVTFIQIKNGKKVASSFNYCYFEIILNEK